jgi:hypothetical protein
MTGLGERLMDNLGDQEVHPRHQLMTHEERLATHGAVVGMVACSEET